MADTKKPAQPESEYSQITVKLPRELRERLDRLADERVVGAGFVVTKALEALFAKIEGTDPLQPAAPVDPPF